MSSLITFGMLKLTIHLL